MPPTYPQQGRVGGKHGLLTGCWVWGFFLDGDEAQDPMVVGTFNFTAKASGEDNREAAQSKTGTDLPEEKAFPKKFHEDTRSTATRTKEEKGKGFGDKFDEAGDTFNHDADSPACDGPKAAQSAESRTEVEQKAEAEVESRAAC